MFELSLTYYDEVCVFLLGLVLGSFTTAVAHRVNNGESWIFNAEGSFARSKCVSCHQNLTSLDLVPLFSWLFLKGRCRYCHNKIFWLYPLTELISGVISLILYFLLGFNWVLLIVLCVQPFLLAQCVKPLYRSAGKP